jgi:hypothetical protein
MSKLSSKFAASGNPFRTATAQQLLDAGFTVVKTGNNASHYTVGLPNPITDDTVDQLNSIFGEPEN